MATEFHRNALGELHREDGPAVINDRFSAWFINGIRHRENFPAVEYFNGNYTWYCHGKCHRLDGPAFYQVRLGDDSDANYWFINGHDVTKKIHAWATERNIDLNNLSELDKLIIHLEWSNYNG
jgi:hypothetical protein